MQVIVNARCKWKATFAKSVWNDINFRVTKCSFLLQMFQCFIAVPTPSDLAVTLLLQNFLAIYVNVNDRQHMLSSQNSRNVVIYKNKLCKILQTTTPLFSLKYVQLDSIGMVMDRFGHCNHICLNSPNHGLNRHSPKHVILDIKNMSFWKGPTSASLLPSVFLAFVFLSVAVSTPSTTCHFL